MVKTLQFRRGNTATVSAITAAEGEILIDTDKDTIIVGDGILAGGFVLARDDKAIAAFNTTNSAFASINSNWSVTNTSLGIANAAYASVNSNWTVMNALYTVANSAYGAANNAGGADTVARTTANGAYTQANAARTHANAAYGQANTAYSYGYNSYVWSYDMYFNTVPAAFSVANAAYTQANLGLTSSSTVTWTSPQTFTAAVSHSANTSFRSNVIFDATTSLYSTIYYAGTTDTNFNPAGIAIDSSDNVYTLFGANSSAFISKINADKTFAWEKSIDFSSGVTGANSPNLFSFFRDSSGNMYLHGLVYDSSYNNYPFIMKLDSSGTVVWVKSYTVWGSSGYGGTFSNAWYEQIGRAHV